MTRRPVEDEPLPTDSPEVRAYVKRLVGLIFVGLIIMTSTAVWAWNRYGKKLEQAPPLPEGRPPITGVPNSDPSE